MMNMILLRAWQLTPLKRNIQIFFLKNSKYKLILQLKQEMPTHSCVESTIYHVAWKAQIPPPPQIHTQECGASFSTGTTKGLLVDFCIPCPIYTPLCLQPNKGNNWLWKGTSGNQPPAKSRMTKVISYHNKQFAAQYHKVRGEAGDQR